MLTNTCPKLPMRNRQETRTYYINQLGFLQVGADYPDYLMVALDSIELHFFLFEALNPADNYGQVYIRCSEIEKFYHSLVQRGVPIHPHGPLQNKPWGQREFSLLDPDHNLLTFGEPI